MTRDDIIRMAREAGISGPNHQGLAEWFGATTPEMERFAALVAAAEREACAKMCERYNDDGGTGEVWGERFADAIRARGAND